MFFSSTFVKALLVGCCFCLLSWTAQAQRAISVGGQLGVVYPFGGDGLLFEDVDAHPQGSYGAIVGVSVLYPLTKQSHLLLGGNWVHQSYRFHWNDEDAEQRSQAFTGAFALNAFQIPISYNYLFGSDRAKWVGKSFIGIGINAGNMITNTGGLIDDSGYEYTAFVKSAKVMDVEGFIGGGLVQRSKKGRQLHLQLAIHINAIQNLSFEANLSDGSDNMESVRQMMRDAKLSLSVIYFPVFKRKGKRGELAKCGVKPTPANAKWR